MRIAEALKYVAKDKARLSQAISDLETVEALYAVGESEKAVDLYGAISSRLRLAFRSCPVLDAQG